MIRRIVNYTLIFLFVFQMVTPFFDGIVKADSPKRLYIDWEAGRFIESAPSDRFFSKDDTRSISGDIGAYITGVIKECKLFIEGTEQTGCSYNGTSITVNANGKITTVYGRQETDPGHHFFRRPEGKSWEHKAKTTPAVHFTPDDVKAGATLTERPGIIPRDGQDENDKPYSYESPGGRDLRYSYSDPDDPAPDYTNEGYAVTASYEAEPPLEFFFSKPATVKDRPGIAIDSTKLTASSIRVTGAAKGKDRLKPERTKKVHIINRASVRDVNTCYIFIPQT